MLRSGEVRPAASPRESAGARLHLRTGHNADPFCFYIRKIPPGDKIHQRIGYTVQKCITNIIQEMMSGILPLRQQQFAAGKKNEKRCVGIVGRVM